MITHNNNIEDSATVGFLEPAKKNYKTYSYRFFILLFFALIVSTNAMMPSCMSSIITNLSAIYQLQISTITWGTALLFFTLYPFTSLVANYVLDEKGLRISVLIGAITTVIGLWIRTFCDQSFWLIFAGQFLGALGQPFLLNIPPKLSANWFPPNERPISTAIASLVNPIGSGVGLVIAHAFVPNDALDPSDITKVKDFMWFLAWFCSVLIVPSALFFKDSPPTPPSKAADAKKYSYKQSLESLKKNSNYLILIASTGFIWGGMNTLAALIQPILEPFNFTGSEAGMVGAFTLLCGLVGSAIMGIHVGKTKKYKRVLLLSASVSVFSLGGVIGVAFVGKLIYPAILACVYGFFTIPLLPLSMELSGEISFPVAEGASGGFLMWMIQVFSVLGTIGIGQLLNNNTKQNAVYSVSILGVMTLIGCVGYILIKIDLRRTRYEEQKESKEDHLDNESSTSQIDTSAKVNSTS